MTTETAPTETAPKKNNAAKAGIAGTAAVLLLKFKAAIFLGLKALSLFKFGWLFSNFASMAVSLGLYTMMFGWRYAITIIILLYIHEMGHFVCMNAYGLKPKAPVFVPFIGAYTAMTNLPGDLATHAWVAFAGPFVGGLAALASYVVGMQTGNTFLVAAANTGAILNLLQLVPIKPFDGGFIAQSITRWLFIPGAVLLGFLAWDFHSPLLIIIAGGAIFSMIAQWKRGVVVTAEPATPFQRLLITVAFVGLAAALSLLFMHSHDALQVLRAHS